MTSRLCSTRKQSNTSYHQTGGMNWWARVGQGEHAAWVDVAKTRGDRLLDCEVDLPPGTAVTIGVGRGDFRRTVREEVETQGIPSEEENHE